MVGSGVTRDSRRGRGHVNGLPAEVRTRVGRTGVVGCEDGERVIIRAGDEVSLLYEPDEAGAEHGGCGGEEGGTEGFGGGKGFGNKGDHIGGHLGGVGGDGAEEEMVVVGHGSVVEERGVVGGTGVFEEDVFGYAVFIRGALKDMSDLIEWVKMSYGPYQRSTDSACRQCNLDNWSMLCQTPLETACPAPHALGNGPHV